MTASSTVAARALRFARFILLAIGFTVAVAGSVAPVAADSPRDLTPADQRETEITIGRPDFSLAQPDLIDGTALDNVHRLPNELPNLRIFLQRFAFGTRLEFRSDLLGSCIGFCTTRPSGTDGAK